MTTELTLADALVFARDHIRASTTSELYAAHSRGSLERIHPGVFIDAGIWEGLRIEDRHLARVFAVAGRYGDVGPFSHVSAAALHGLPIVNAVAPRAEVTMGPTSGGRSRTGITRHASTRGVESTWRQGVRVTTLERTLIDLALTQRMSTAVVALDDALHRGVLDLAMLDDELVALGRCRGWRRVERAVLFADERAETPGESMSRVAIDVLGFEPPELQREFYDADGFVARTDYAWLIGGRWHAGEFDGYGKYLRELTGRDPAETVMIEKEREDRLRRMDVGMSRWGWSAGRNLRALDRILTQGGVPQRRRFSSTPPEYDRHW